MTLRLRDVEVDGKRCDVVVADGRVVDIGPTGSATASADAVIDGRGGALIPGLWDHHIHLTAAAAALASVTLESSMGAVDFEAALRRGRDGLDRGEWLRAVGYHESMAGDLDRHGLDRVVADHPVRLQHRSGARWILNSAACTAVGLDDAEHSGVEHGVDGAATGRVTGADDWLRDRLPPGPPVVDLLGRLSDRMTASGVVGVTDTGPDVDVGRWNILAAAATDGTFVPRVWVTGGPELAAADPPEPLRLGPVKLYLADHALPDLDTVVEWVADAHRHRRPVAFHSVTRVSLAIAMAALQDAGTVPGDRIEHGAVIAPDCFDALSRLGICVVTQPVFVAERGDSYLADVDADDVPHLYRCASLLAAGIGVAGSSDAPYSEPDPWKAIGAAVERRTRRGRILGIDERLTPTAALDLFLGPPALPGGPPRRVESGSVADLCLLDSPLQDVLAAPSADRVRTTMIGGTIVYDADAAALRDTAALRTEPSPRRS